MAMAMATKRTMATNRDNTDTGDRKVTAATMAMGGVTAQRTWPLTQRLERGESNAAAAPPPPLTYRLCCRQAAAASAKLLPTPPSLQMSIAFGGTGAHRWASKRAMMMAARAMAMAMATKRAIATNRDNTDTGDGKVTAATMAMGRVTTQRTWPLTQRLERGECVKLK